MYDEIEEMRETIRKRKNLDKGKFSFAQLQMLGQKKNDILADLNNLDVLVNHYSSILKEEVKEEVKKES